MTEAPEDDLRTLWQESAEAVASQVEEGTRLPVKDLLMPLLVQVASSEYLKGDSVGFWEEGDSRLWLPRFVFQRTRVVKRRIRVGIFAGIHGDEPAGILGLMDFVRLLDDQPELGREYELWIYPLCNPSGYLAGRRECASGRDLNREFWKNSAEAEVNFLEKEILRRQFDGILSLHSGDTGGGFYGLAQDPLIAEHMVAPALLEADRILSQSMDTPSGGLGGFHAGKGIQPLRYDGILCAPPTQHPQPFEVILESPQGAPLELQRKAFVAAMREILRSYRGFIAYGGDL